MTIDEYNELSESEKLSVLQHDGQYLIHLDILEQTFTLFKLRDFHVEVCFDSVTQVICGLRTFDDQQGLAPYLDALNSTPPV
jgi:hypothetical protein